MAVTPGIGIDVYKIGDHIAIYDRELWRELMASKVVPFRMESIWTVVYVIDDVQLYVDIRFGKIYRIDTDTPGASYRGITVGMEAGEAMSVYGAVWDEENEVLHEPGVAGLAFGVAVPDPSPGTLSRLPLTLLHVYDPRIGLVTGSPPADALSG